MTGFSFFIHSSEKQFYYKNHSNYSGEGLVDLQSLKLILPIHVFLKPKTREENKSTL
jgi:hypothetical protein